MSKRSISVLKYISLFGGLIFYAPVALLVRTRMGMTYSQFFLLQAVLSISIFIFEVPCGYITDKIGYRKTLILNSLFTFLARILMVFAGNFLFFSIEAVCEGISIALYSGTMSGYIYQQSEEEFVHALSIVDNYSHLGFILSTLLFPIIYSVSDINGLLVLTALCSFIGFLMAFRLPKEKTQTIHEKIHFSFHSADIPISLFIGMIDMSFLIINFFYVEILVELHINESYISLMILFYTMVQLSIPKLTRKFGENNLFRKICGCLGITTLFLFAVSLCHSRIVLLPMLFLPTMLSLLSVYFEKYQNNYIDTMGYGQQRATILSCYNMSANMIEIFFLFGSANLKEMQVHDIFAILGVTFSVILTFILIFQTKKKNHNTKRMGLF